jgi:hypothetical protein
VTPPQEIGRLIGFHAGYNCKDAAIMTARHCLGILVVAGIAWSLSATSVAAPKIASDNLRCEQVTVGNPVVFHDRTLVETPDIASPELKLSNALLSHRCTEAAVRLLDQYVKAHPADYRAAFVEARLAWISGNTAETEKILTIVLREHPDFASAQVLQASLLIEQNRLDEANPLLESLSLHSPTDLWVFMDHLRLEALRSPSQALRETLLEITRNPGFPPSARETAAQIGSQLPNMSRDQFEAFLWADLDYESATPMACKINKLAFLLSEDGGRFAQARALLESPRGQAADCLGMEGNRVLLAQTYLMEAARISAAPSAANAALVSKANEILGGNWSELARYVIGRPQFANLQPFLASATAPSDVDQYGRTQICNAITFSDVAAVQAQLDLGADVNGRCAGFSLIGYVVMNTGERTAVARQTILRQLRAAGAQPSEQEIKSCRDPVNGPVCAKWLLPLLAP